MKYSLSFKCDCYQPHNYCNCPQKFTGEAVFLQSVNEVAGGIAEVMNICGIPYTNAKRAIDVIVYYFIHYDEVRLRIDTVPQKRMYRLDLIQDLGCKCLMTSREAQISYTIIKRAFRAFYYGTDEGGVPNPLLYPQLKHSPECLWYHAARRTAQVYACYEGMFPICQKDIELQIRTVYFKIYERLKSLPRARGHQECLCLRCFKRLARANLKATCSLHRVVGSYEKIYEKETAECNANNAAARSSVEPYIGNETESIDLLQGEHRTCDCPTLDCLKTELNVPEFAKSTNTGYSQGPFECNWNPITDEEAEPVDALPDFQLPEEQPCPPDTCDEDLYSLESCISICECTCDVCECVLEEEEIETSEEKSESQQVDMTDDLEGPRAPSEKYNFCRVPLKLLSKSEISAFQAKQKPKDEKKAIKKKERKKIPKISGENKMKMARIKKEMLSIFENGAEKEKKLKLENEGNKVSRLRFEES
uniref:Uncharacterized protein n=1 Tax=Glossina pallidipes TaxID=7398 RepID=A0A1A9ZJK5_GLOPL